VIIGRYNREAPSETFDRSHNRKHSTRVETWEGPLIGRKGMVNQVNSEDSPKNEEIHAKRLPRTRKRGAETSKGGIEEKSKG